AALSMLQVGEVTDGSEVRGIFGEGGSDSGFERCGAVRLQELEQPSGEGAEMHPAGGGELEEARGARGGVVQAIHRAVSAAGALLRFQRLDMRGQLDLRIAVEAAGMSGDNSFAIDDAHGLQCSEHFQYPADVGVRDRVVVEIEAHVWRFV